MEHARAHRLRVEEAQSDSATVEPARRQLREVVEPEPRRSTPDRRTVEIKGRPGPQPARARRSRATARNPDRLALWAVVLCLLLALVAAATARGESADRADADAPPATRPATGA